MHAAKQLGKSPRIRWENAIWFWLIAIRARAHWQQRVVYWIRRTKNLHPRARGPWTRG